MGIKNSTFMVMLKDPSFLMLKIRNNSASIINIAIKTIALIIAVLTISYLIRDSVYISFNKILDNIGLILLVIGVATVIEKKNFGLVNGIAGAMILLISATAFSSSNPSNLATERRLEDIDYLYEIIEENFPLLKGYQIDWEELKETAKENVKNNITEDVSPEKADEIFSQEVSRILWGFNNNLHHVVGRTFFVGHSVYMTPEYESNFNLWDEIIMDENVLSWYNLDYIDDHNIINPFRRLKPRDFTVEGNYRLAITSTRTGIVVPNEVAYLGFYNMVEYRVEEDGKIIREFFEEVKDYDTLIIDLRDVRGGIDRYWRENVVAPLLREELTVENPFFIRGSYTKPFYDSRGIDLLPISQLQEHFPHIASSDVTDFEHFGIHNVTIKPEEPIGFKGDIYLIVDESVYDTTERFASFAKDSGFATLVGRTTIPNAKAFEPLIFSLPNSGLLVSYRGELIVNGDGNITSQMGTVPHHTLEYTSSKVPTYRADTVIQHILGLRN